jgi:signal recognition particle subunit SRP54
MFDVVAKGFRDVRNRFEGRRELTEDNVDDALKQIRMSMLEADVNFQITKDFINRVKEKALGEVVKVKAKGEDETMQVSPGDQFIKICHDELESLLGPVDSDVHYSPERTGPTIIMLVGLQGSGKTTTTAKLASYLMDREDKKPMMVGADVYRPAAIDQLRVLGDQIGVPVHAREDADPVDVCTEAVDKAKEHDRDVVLFDTAGRLAVDDVLMEELEEIVEATQPENIFLVADAMIGQDAVTTAKEFNSRLEVDGFIMTKLDGDARGGAALSIKEVTGKPIKFIGTGEDMEDLEEFRPEGLANRILGFGDVMGLMDRFERTLSEEEARQAEEDAKKMLSGEFDFDDFYQQLDQMSRMGSMTELMEMMPFGADLPDGAEPDDAEMTRIRAIIESMTTKEKTEPDLLTRQPSRIRRIARGSGTSQEKVEEVIQQFNMMRNMMEQFSGGGGGLLSKIPGFDKLSSLNDMKNMDLGEMFGDMFGGGGDGGGGMPGMGDMDLPPGYTPPGGGQQQQGSGGESESMKDKKKKRKRRKRKKVRKKRRRRKKKDDDE